MVHFPSGMWVVFRASTHKIIVINKIVIIVYNNKIILTLGALFLSSIEFVKAFYQKVHAICGTWSTVKLKNIHYKCDICLVT